MPMRPKPGDTSQPIRHHTLLMAARVMLFIASAALLAAALIGWRLYTAEVGNPLSAGLALLAKRGAAVDTRISSSSTDPTSDVPRVGLVAGHAGYDPGAVCPDGRTEADVNMSIAQEVERLLVRQGYQVDLLEEFDERLPGYRSDALVSIHADSCEVPGVSGFKVARVTDSAIPEAEDRLVECLYQEYERITRLPRHSGSITDDMTSYHAFREIDDHTPGAIIETGFLLGDGGVLIHQPKLAARGIAAGVTCFLVGEK